VPYKPFGPQDQLEITSLGTEFALFEIVGAAVGYWLDSRWDTLPWCLLGGVVVGFVLGFGRIWQVAKQPGKHTEKAKKDGRS